MSSMKGKGSPRLGAFARGGAAVFVDRVAVLVDFF
jgi:hypothetical protein